MADRFEKNLREKLKDYERPVPEDIWKGIEQGMAGRRKRGRRIMPIWYVTAGIAAAACLLVVMYMKNDTQMQQTVAETERRHNARKAVDNAVGDVMGSDIIAGITAMAENGTREKTMTAHLTAPETDDEGSITTTADNGSGQCAAAEEQECKPESRVAVVASLRHSTGRFVTSGRHSFRGHNRKRKRLQ